MTVETQIEPLANRLDEITRRVCNLIEEIDDLRAEARNHHANLTLAYKALRKALDHLAEIEASKDTITKRIEP